MFYGFGGACAFGIIAYAFKPDTRYVILPRSESDGGPKEGIVREKSGVIGGSKVMEASGKDHFAWLNRN